LPGLNGGGAAAAVPPETEILNGEFKAMVDRTLYDLRSSDL